MKKLALISLLVISFVDTSYANAAAAGAPVGVTDVHVRVKHAAGGAMTTEVVGAKHVGAGDENATLFFSGLGKFLDDNFSKVKEVAKSVGKDAIGALNAKVNKNATSAQVEAASSASSPLAED